ncbi:thiamine-phosphate kinase [Marinicellulosiphila megalodicopiae]|uniref:thiamine-phosphate kinase n=1 Tax=Marinicellulosiphila megalodicopiae TaxID=2724896 RepID=UPI003BB0BD12
MTSTTSGEFELIARYFQNWPSFHTSNTSIQIPNGDDCLVFKSESPIAISVDTLVENVHFLSSSPAHGVGYRALASSVSDLIAMGAKPIFFTLAITFCKDEVWLEQFSQGLKQAAQDFKIDLLGGDTTKTKLKNASVITIQVHGECETPIQRKGAKAGDLICVTGNIGNAGAAVELLEQTELNEDQHALLNSFYYPKPPAHLLPELANKATSAIDISDGLLQDLLHLCRHSQLQACLEVDHLPLSSAIKNEHDHKQAQKFALTGGDDYQVCFTIDAKHQQWIEDNHITVIGNMQTGLVDIVDTKSESITAQFSKLGYQHF